MQVVSVPVLLEQETEDVRLGPLLSKYDRQLLHVVNRALPNGENVVLHPFETNWAQLLIEEGFAELSSQHWELFNHGLLHAPVFVSR